MAIAGQDCLVAAQTDGLALSPGMTSRLGFCSSSGIAVAPVPVGHGHVDVKDEQVAAIAAGVEATAASGVLIIVRGSGSILNSGSVDTTAPRMVVRKVLVTKTRGQVGLSRAARLPLPGRATK